MNKCEAIGCNEDGTTLCDRCNTIVCRTCARLKSQPAGNVRVRHVQCPRKNRRPD